MNAKPPAVTCGNGERGWVGVGEWVGWEWVGGGSVGMGGWGFSPSDSRKHHTVFFGDPSLSVKWSCIISQYCLLSRSFYFR